MIDRFLKALKRLGVVSCLVIIGYVALMAYASPETTNVTSNLDGAAPLTTRRLDPSVIPTTTAHTLTSGPQRTTTTTTVARQPADEFTVIFRGRAVTIRRTALTQPIFNMLEGMTR